jgi:signal transduction histidine kinase
VKTQTKIALIIGFICVTIVVVFGFGIYYFLINYSYEDFYKRLETRAKISVQHNLSPESSNSTNLISLKNKYLEKLQNEKETIFEVKKNEELKYNIGENEFSKSFVEKIIKNGKAKDKKNNIFFFGQKFSKEGKEFVLILSAENYYGSHHLLFMRNILLVSILLVVLIVTLLSIYFAKHIFDPIKKIISNVNQISTENIHLRLESNNNDNEISELIFTFNELLNRIETSFETQKNFISNASHEFGTPLTAIMGEADVALIKERTPEQYQKTLMNILSQAERLDEITKSLLFLAQTGYKGNSIDLETLRVDELIWDTKKIIDKIIPKNKITVDLSLFPADSKKLKINGNKQLLQLAFANILNNACKYSNNTEVSVFIVSSDKNVIVTIKDKGIGIPEEEIPFIYDPFFRASNTSLFEGYGIGLPLTRNIVHLHKGKLILSSIVNEGTTVQIKIPLVKF